MYIRIEIFEILRGMGGWERFEQGMAGRRVGTRGESEGQCSASWQKGAFGDLIGRGELAVGSGMAT